MGLAPGPSGKDLLLIFGPAALIIGLAALALVLWVVKLLT